MIFKKATTNDSHLISETMKRIHKNMENKDLYVIDSEEFIRESIDGIHGFGLLAIENDILAGYFIVRFPAFDEKEHLGDYIGLDTEQKKLSVYMDSAAVLPEFRGQGLQNRMLTECENLLAETIYKHALSTISPHNTASLRSLIKNGYKVVKTAKLYEGLERNILYKEL